MSVYYSNIFMVANVGNPCQNHGLACQSSALTGSSNCQTTCALQKLILSFVGNMHEKKLGPVVDPRALRAKKNRNHFLCFVRK